MSRTLAKVPIVFPPGTHALHLVRITNHPIKLNIHGKPIAYANFYQVWIHTRDFVYGTYLRLWDCGKIERVTERADRGEEVILIKPSD